MAHFYHTVIEIESIIASLDELNLSDSEKKHLAELIDSSMHHTILDLVLSELKEGEKEAFLKTMHTEGHEKTWEFLNTRIESIEDKIKESAKKLREKIKDDIKESKRLRSVDK